MRAASMLTLLLLACVLPKPSDPPFVPGTESGDTGGPDTAPDSAETESGGQDSAGPDTALEDRDGDGATTGTDCDDDDPQAFPGAPERCNGLDDDCDGTVDESPDADADGHADAACGGDDCADADASVVPGATDVCGDGIDQDCSGEDPSCGFSGALLLADAAGKRYADTYADAGRLVRAADLDGDGDDEVLIGAIYYAGVRGAAFVLDGPLTGTEALSSSAIVLAGEAPSDEAGRAIGVGDLDGDGVADVGVGAAGADQLYVVFGPVSSDRALADADLRLVGRAGSLTGHGAAVADVTGDGIDDAVVGSHRDSTLAFDAGALRIAPGPLAAGERDLDDTATARFFGQSAEQYACRHVHAGADFDGDGIGDILCAAPYLSTTAPRAGGVYVLSGGWSGDRRADDADAVLLGTGPDEVAGEESTAGDLDGDGLADAVIGARSNATGTRAGAAYVAYGPLSGELLLTASDVIVEGSAAELELGMGLATGDVDADGATDLLVGGPSTGLGPGVTWLFHGPVVGHLTDADASAAFSGERNGDGAGEGLALPDLDADGLLEVVVGASAESTGAARAGAIYANYAPE